MIIWNIKQKLSLVLSIGLIFLSACTTTPENGLAHSIPNITINEKLYNRESVDLIAHEDIFKLTSEQEKQFLANYQQKLALGMEPHKALELYINNVLSGFTYYGETYTAEQAMRLKKGNCMSLAVLTTALTQIAGLDFDFRLLNTVPVFQQKSNLILSSSHVQTIIYQANFIPEKNVFYLSRPGVIIDYFPSNSNDTGKKFGLNNFLSMYYKNIASDALVENNFNKAFVYAKEALSLDKKSVSAINLLAVLHRRKSDYNSAEAIYLEGLAYQPNDISLLSNYIVLLQTTERFAEADRLAEQLIGLDDPNPYLWLEQAYIAQSKSDYESATSFYQKVLSQAPYVNEAYMGLYHIYKQQKNMVMAEHMLKQALEWTYEIEQRKLYKYKLYTLQDAVAAL